MGAAVSERCTLGRSYPASSRRYDRVACGDVPLVCRREPGIDIGASLRNSAELDRGSASNLISHAMAGEPRRGIRFKVRPTYCGDRTLGRPFSRVDHSSLGCFGSGGTGRKTKAFSASTNDPTPRQAQGWCGYDSRRRHTFNYNGDVDRELVAALEVFASSIERIEQHENGAVVINDM